MTGNAFPNREKRAPSRPRASAREVLLKGIFWRVLIIEGILLVWSVAYRMFAEDATAVELFWYTVRILVLIAIIMLFLLVTLQRFLAVKIIRPLEIIAMANRDIDEDAPKPGKIPLPEDTPGEIVEIVSTRDQMLEAIYRVSRDRLRLMNFIRNTFDRYLSKKVVDEILESPEGLKIGGRKETVTILMADLRGFTSLSETRDPEEMVQLLNRYLDQMSRIILSYDGTIDEFIGDSILAVFGVPERHEDDPYRAVACALSMQKGLVGLNGEIVGEGYPPLEMGIGINTGTVIVGNIGSELRAKYGIVGATVNTAARIEANSTGGQVLVGESTYLAVRDLVTADPPHTVMMKGLKKPLVSYPLTAIGPPYNVEFQPPADTLEGVEIQLPFHCWRIHKKKIEEEAVGGETVRLGENFITASLDSTMEPLTDIKLAFDFCTDAHCFEDIYAKVVAVDTGKERPLYSLRITSMDQKDRDVLNRWMASVSE